MEQYIEEAPRSFRLAWDDLDGLLQRNTAAQLNLTEHPEDMKYFESVCDKDTKGRGKMAEEKFENVNDGDTYDSGKEFD